MKFFSLDIIICMFLVFLGLYFAPIVMGMIDFFDPIVTHFENFRLSDIQYHEMGEKDYSQSDLVLVSDSDDKGNDFDNYQLARLIEEIDAENPKIIGIDKVLKKSDDPEKDEYLANVLSKLDNVVLSSHLYNYDKSSNRFASIDMPDSMFVHNAVIGYNNILWGQDQSVSTIRNTYPKTILTNDSLCKSLHYEIIEKYNDNLTKIIDDRNNESEVINYIGKLFTRPWTSEVINHEDLVNMEGKIVFLGEWIYGAPKDLSIRISDLYYTPMNEYWSGKSFPDMSRGQIHANILAMMLEKSYYTMIPYEIMIIISVIIVYFTIILFTFISLKYKKLYELSNLIIFVLESLLLFYSTIWLFHEWRVAVDLTPVIFALVITIFVYEGYNESLKPLTIELYHKLFRRPRP